MDDERLLTNGASVFICKIPYSSNECGSAEIPEIKKREKSFARKLLEYAVGSFAPPYADVVITKNRYGAPTTQGAFLSLSHTSFYALAAVSGMPIGCDAEYMREGRDFEKLLAKVMTESEKSAYKSIIDKKEFFYTLWTAKEAAFKRKGIPPFEPSKTETKGVKVFRTDDCCFAVDSPLHFDVRFLSFVNGKFVKCVSPSAGVIRMHTAI